MPDQRVWLLVPKSHGKSLKNALQEAKLYNTKLKVDAQQTHHLALPTSVLSADGSYTTFPTALKDLLVSYQEASVLLRPVEDAVHTMSLSNPISKTLHALSHPPSSRSCAQNEDLQLLARDLPRFERYTNFVLFNSDAFTSPPWAHFLSSHPTFFALLAAEFKVRHLARKNAIPREDILRRPTGLEPLYGDFDDFWARNEHGKVVLVWSPVHTMASRGNASEKDRIATCDKASSKVVVDLYAGIGYFALGYLYAGAKRVFACELNPYSIEGLKRGADANGFTWTEIQPVAQPQWPEEQLLILPHDNALCTSAFEDQADIVNLGLLPSAEAGLPVALAALNPRTGGLLRVHDEVSLPPGAAFKAHARKAKAEQVAGLVAALAKEKHREVQVDVEKIVMVKSLGTNLEHLVFDLMVRPA